MLEEFFTAIISRSAILVEPKCSLNSYLTHSPLLPKASPICLKAAPDCLICHISSIFSIT